MNNAIGRGLEKLLGLNQVLPAWREEFAAQPAHERIFWWRVGLTAVLLTLLVLGSAARDEGVRNRRFAWASAIAFPLIGAWFVVVCQTLITDASIYVLFLIGTSVLLPLPGLLKLLIYPVSLAVLLAGFHWIPVDPTAGFHVSVNATLAVVGALVTEAVAMRTYAADFVKSRQLDEERHRADEMLRNVLPLPILQRLRQDAGAPVEYHPEVSILFADFVGFGRLAQSLSPSEMIGLLDALFLEFDEAADRFGVEKIKTLGDSYMAACGVPLYVRDHAQRVAEFGLRIQSIAARFQSDRDLPVHFRIGLHTGPAIAGVIGRRKFCYDLWGDTVSTASHLQAAGAPGYIHLSHAMREALGDAYRFETRAPIRLKDRPPEQTYYLVGRAAEGELLKDRVTGDAPGDAEDADDRRGFSTTADT